MSHPCIIKLLLAIGLFSAGTIGSQAQLSGEVNLGGISTESDTASSGGIKEITVTGIGTTLESAEKQALAAAFKGPSIARYINI